MNWAPVSKQFSDAGFPSHPTFRKNQMRVVLKIRRMPTSVLFIINHLRFIRLAIIDTLEIALFNLLYLITPSRHSLNSNVSIHNQSGYIDGILATKDQSAVFNLPARSIMTLVAMGKPSTF